MLILEGRTSIDIAIAQRRQGSHWVLLEYGAAENRDKMLEIDSRQESSPARRRVARLGFHVCVSRT